VRGTTSWAEAGKARRRAAKKSRKRMMRT